MGTKLIVKFDIKDDRPHKSIKIYTVNGDGVGNGEKVIQKAGGEISLFEESLGFVSYLVDLDIDKIQKLEKEALVQQQINKSKSKEEVAISTDVESTDDPQEDEWVRKSLWQLTQSKAKVDLDTVRQLREDYRNMKLHKAKSSDDTLKEEPVKIICSYCGVEGHNEENCFEKLEAEKQKAETEIELQPEDVEEVANKIEDDFADAFEIEEKPKKEPKTDLFGDL